MRIKWSFENGCISPSQLGEITEKFKRVLPYIQSEIDIHGIWNKHKGIDEGTLYTAFKTDQDYVATDGGFFFGIHNINSGQNIYVRNERYKNAIVTFLSIAKQVLIHDIHVECDTDDGTWRKGISLCQNILGHDYDLMDITQNGKLRFAAWELVSYGK